MSIRNRLLLIIFIGLFDSAPILAQSIGGKDGVIILAQSVGGRDGISNSVGAGAAPPVSAPSVVSVVPNSGPIAGGTPVTITGNNFSAVSSVKFGLTTAVFSVFSINVIHATSPAHALGTIDVTVTNTLGTSPTSSADEFTYITCSNSLDFSQACNSQYIGIF